MKRTIIAAASVFLMAWAFSSCGEECMTCKQNVYLNGVFQETLQTQKFCGNELIRYKDRPPMVSGSTTTKWECE